MGWKDVLKKIGKGAAVVGGIAAKGVGLDVFEGLKAAGILKDPEAEAKAREMLMEFELALVAAETNALAEINKTMREEAKSDHWAQWLWRPVIGFTFSGVIINNYIIVMYFPAVQPIVIPDTLWTAMLVILGAAVGTRGWEKVQRVIQGRK